MRSASAFHGSIVFKRDRSGQSGETDDGQKPMRMLVDWNNQVVLFEDVHFLGPRLDSAMAFLRRRQLVVVLDSILPASTKNKSSVTAPKANLSRRRGH